MMLSKEQIFEVKDLKIELVQVPEWGGEVYVRSLTGTERDSFEASIVELKGQSTRMNMANMRAKLLSLSVCDAEGNRLFSDSDVSALGKKSAAALQRLFDVATRLSSLTNQDLEALEKN